MTETTIKGAWLEYLPWPEVKARLDAGAVVVLPIGAIAKEHGHHLPMKTDFLLARELASRVARALPVLIAPVVSAGYYPAFGLTPWEGHLVHGRGIRIWRDDVRRFLERWL